MLSMIELKIVANTGRERIEILLTTNEIKKRAISCLLFLMPLINLLNYTISKLKCYKMLKEEKQTNGTK